MTREIEYEIHAAPRNGKTEYNVGVVTLGKELPHRDATCTKCGKTKRPTRAYMALLKSKDLPYICQQCRANVPAPAMDLGKLGAL